ncbi:hypothetical protein BC829DRAFT_404920 [Chytridium lagenaria]|nr:hypothetical protein BC829DRAFT_404920 [Chytridium lagenaria]
MPLNDNHTDNDGGGQSDGSGRRKRISLACDDCKRRKYKCDGARPSCGACTKSHLTCRYTPRPENKNPAPPKPKGPRALHAAFLRERIKQLESRAASLNIDLSQLYGNSRMGYEDDEESDDEGDFNGSAYHHSSLPSPDHLKDGTNITTNGLPVAKPRTKKKYGTRPTGSASEHSAPIENPLSCPCEDCFTKAVSEGSVNAHDVQHDFVPKEALKELVELWFVCHYHVDPLPMFHRTTFVRSLSGPDPPSELLMHALYATAAQYSAHPAIAKLKGIDENYSLSDTFSVGEPFYAKARSLIMHYIETPSLSTVQALILISVSLHSRDSQLTTISTALFRYHRTDDGSLAVSFHGC